MIKIYDNGSIYVGEMVLDQRVGKGSLYLLDDFFAGYKVSGNWHNDKLHGFGQVETKTYKESGNFDKCVQTGSFFRIYTDGRCSAVSYDNGKNVVEETLSSYSESDQYFGCIKLSEQEFYVGDVFNGQPFGYGVIYNIDENKKITNKTFVEIYGQNLVYGIELNNKNQDVLEK